MDTSDGGVSVPQDTDGVTRYPSIDEFTNISSTI